MSESETDKFNRDIELIEDISDLKFELDEKMLSALEFVDMVENYFENQQSFLNIETITEQNCTDIDSFMNKIEIISKNNELSTSEIENKISKFKEENPYSNYKNQEIYSDIVEKFKYKISHDEKIIDFIDKKIGDKIVFAKEMIYKFHSENREKKEKNSAKFKNIFIYLFLSIAMVSQLFCSLSWIFGLKNIVFEYISISIALILAVFSIVVRSKLADKFCTLFTGLLLIFIQIIRFEQLESLLLSVAAIICILVSIVIFLIKNTKITLRILGLSLMVCSLVASFFVVFGMDKSLISSKLSFNKINVFYIGYILSIFSSILIIVCEIIYWKKDYVLCLIGVNLNIITILISLLLSKSVNITIFNLFTINFFFSLLCLVISSAFLMSYIPSWAMQILLLLMLVFSALTLFNQKIKNMFFNCFYVLPFWVYIIIVLGIIAGIILSFNSSKFHKLKIFSYLFLPKIFYFFLVIFSGFYIIYMPIVRNINYQKCGVLCSYSISKEDKIVINQTSFECKKIIKNFCSENDSLDIVLKNGCLDRILNKAQYIILNSRVKVIEENVFHNCENLTIICTYKEDELPLEWNINFSDGSCTIIFDATNDIINQLS